MPLPTDRKRLEIPAQLYDELAQHARQLHVSTTSLATMLLADAMRAAEARSHIPFHARQAITEQMALCDHQWPEDPALKTITCPLCGLTLHRAE